MIRAEADGGEAMSSQDALEEELLLTTMRTHLKFAGSTCAEGMRRVAATLSLISTSSPPLLTTVTTALLLLLLACGACAVLAMSERLARRALGVQESGGFNSASSEKRCVLAHWDGEKVAVHGIRGRRPAMEDRFVSVTVEVAGNKKIWINAVLDGHGGEVRTSHVYISTILIVECAYPWYSYHVADQHARTKRFECP